MAIRKHTHAIVQPRANGLVTFIGSIIPIKSDRDYGTGIIWAEWIIAELDVSRTADGKFLWEFFVRVVKWRQAA
jgi:hypothetical protein